MNRPIRVHRFRLFLLVLALTGAFLAPEAEGQPPDGRYVYTIKYLCSGLEPFPQVFHWTDINILNPAKQRPAQVTKKFIISGTQDHLTEVEPVRDRFELPPNHAASITCDEIQRMFRIPLSTPMVGFVEIESDLKLTVVGVYDKCVPGPRADVFMSSRVTTDLELEGVEVGRLEMVGPAVVQKEEMRIDPERQTFLQPTELVAMELEGELNWGDLTVPVRLIESPKFQSEGRIVGEIDPLTMAPLFPARSTFDVFFEITSDDPRFQEKFGRLFNVEATRVQAAITGIPPGYPSETIPRTVDVQRLERLFPDAEIASTRGGLELRMQHATLGRVDDPINVYCDPGPTRIFSARSSADPIGSVSNHCHQPNPPPPPPEEHPKVPCANASIDVEYIEPMRRPRAARAKGRGKP